MLASLDEQFNVRLVNASSVDTVSICNHSCVHLYHRPSTCSIFLTADHWNYHLIYFYLFMIPSTELSHKKLIVNVEKTVGAQLNDAEAKIAEVQKVG